MITSLHNERLEKVIHALLESGSKSVLDLGCGQGELLFRLAANRHFTTLVGIDTSVEALAEARRLLELRGLDQNGTHLSLHHASFTEFIEDFAGFDAAVMLETIEHVPPRRLSAVEKAVFAGYRPRTVLITTPNCEYNVIHGLPQGAFRHRGHHFEWTREKFQKWSEGVAGRHGYRIAFDDIGAADPELGSSSQMAHFFRP